MRVLMIGAGRGVRGGVSSVVNGYYEEGLDKLVELTYLPTMEDGTRLKKLIVAAVAAVRFLGLINKADILHVHMSADASFYRKAWFIKRAAARHKKIIIHMHGSTFDSFYTKRCTKEGQREVRDVFEKSHAVIALSEYWRDFMADNICDKNKIHLLYNSIHLPPEAKTSYDDDNVLFMGIIGERKGSYDLIRAFKDVKAAVPDARLFMAGDGEVQKAGELAKELGLSECILFPGWVRDGKREELFESCSIYALPSYNEGMPMSVLEAMGRGLCTISTDVGGIPHIIKDGQNGLIIKPGNIAALSGALCSLLSDKNHKKKLGEAGRKTVEENFDLKDKVRDLVDIYKGLYAGK